ncbi:M20/M25/M40 family metallo-hydrolase [Sinanaerobacter sp. ZZT-01]|uniref:M20/M25/M40 family metallo-hydrolase n=1 Tax=Sinanaerobacter sp. ZZT-01 TaxID=3111540 RepID=UPI002D79658B|nr:M20/M25/M40 family metallo-hydrolase [Sinanaerobacter sp. ZZT-01]WRR92160.1 M20/M25/M40 family metallo-hydrolase [Sinanaerobacter sp. ZZT-01]
MKLAEKIENNLMTYLSEITHTGTALEKNNENFFKKWFNSLSYLKENPEHCGFYDIKNDYLQRRIPWALLKGTGNQTIVMLHHTDTVDVEDYGKYKEYAYNPYELEKLFKTGEVELNESAKIDLESGEWLFGRGASDMKGGGCIHLSLFEEYTKKKDFKGNILLIGVPDEENLSAGMRSAVYLLKDMRDQYQLEYKLLLNVEPHDRIDENNMTLYDGSVGKIMPIFLARGKLAHVGQIYQGLNPVNLLSAIVRKTELNPIFIEKAGNTVTTPPAWLYFKDRKNTYDVSLPLTAGGYMSILSLTKSPKEILDQLKSISQEAFEELVSDMEYSYEKYKSIAGIEGVEHHWEPKVKYYGEIYNEIVEEKGEAFKVEIAKYQKQLENKIINGEISRVEGTYKLMEKTLEYYSDLSPIVVIAMAAPYYPSTNNSMLESASEVNELVGKLDQYAKKEFGNGIYVQNYFTGISDLSYAMFTVDKENIEYVQNNMLFWGGMYYIPLEIIKEQSMPVLNVGPWGKDLHKYTERVFKKDLFENIPKLTDYIINSLLG